MLSALTSLETSTHPPSTFLVHVVYPTLVGGFLLLFAVIGYIARRIILKSDENRATLTSTLQKHSESLDAIAAKQALAEVNRTDGMRRLVDVEDVLEQVRTSTGADHIRLTDHLAWHERQAS